MYFICSVSCFFFNNATDVYKLCIAVPEPFADSLYTSTKEFLEEHVQGLYKVS